MNDDYLLRCFQRSKRPRYEPESQMFKNRLKLHANSCIIVIGKCGGLAGKK